MEIIRPVVKRQIHLPPHIAAKEQKSVEDLHEAIDEMIRKDELEMARHQRRLAIRRAGVLLATIIVAHGISYLMR